MADCQEATHVYDDEEMEALLSVMKDDDDTASTQMIDLEESLTDGSENDDDDDSQQECEKVEEHPQQPQWHTYAYGMLFFCAMVGAEVATEKATLTFGHLDSLASAVSCFQSVSCLVFPLLASRGRTLREMPLSPTELAPYLRMALLVLGATVPSVQAVRYVTYPTKVVFRSAKLIPTMLVAAVWQRQKFARLEYLAALLLCIGAAGYSCGSGRHHPHDVLDEDDNHLLHEDSTDPTTSSTTELFTPNSHVTWGVSLLVFSILCDAIVANYQKVLLNTGVDATQLMFNVNSVGSALVLTFMLVTGQLWGILEACHENPSLLLLLVSVGVGMSTAVWAYVNLIQATSGVVAVGVATVRKVVTMCLSYIIFPKPILQIHIVSGNLVLLGLILSHVAKEQKKRA